MKYKVFLMVLLCNTPYLFAQEPKALPVDSTVIKTLFFTGLREKLNEDYNKASEIFNKIILLDPRNAAAQYEIAVVNYRQNNLIQAEMAIKKATALEANNTWYWMMMAEVYKRKGDMLAMTGALDQLIRLVPDKADYYYDRSNAYLLAGKSAEAMRGYDELEKRFGASDDLVRARKRVSSGGQMDAVDIKKPMELSAFEQKMLTAENLYKQGDLTAALTQFMLVLEDNNQLYKAWEQVLNIQLLLNKYKDAIKIADQALSIYPNQAILYYFMAFALQKDQQIAKALSNVKSALELDPENGVYLELYGDVLFLSGDSAQALLQWKKAKLAGNGSGKLNRKINEQKYLE